MSTSDWKIPHEVQEFLSEATALPIDEIDEAPLVELRITARKGDAQVLMGLTMKLEKATA